MERIKHAEDLGADAIWSERSSRRLVKPKKVSTSGTNISLIESISPWLFSIRIFLLARLPDWQRNVRISSVKKLCLLHR